ncbi:hypothetical protein EDB84DRAFT_1670019 [Lactarius hengduanensis]|nr:hypothetical protein EDB84DRAFT_1670019 [Lactarius hengduanensis]
MSSPLKVLRTYAKLSDPSLTALPPTVYFSHTKHTLTIFDAYPKALFHFLTLRVLADEAARLRGVVEEEMRARYGFAWDVWVGFHAVPSMEHLHLHVLSSDLTAPALKTKRHYNSFSPRTGFFVPLAEVRTWFDDAAAAVRRLAPEEYEPRLKYALECFRCEQPAKNMPALKKHLQDEFDALRKREGKSKKHSREAEDGSASDRETPGGATKGKGKKKVARLS